MTVPLQLAHGELVREISDAQPDPDPGGGHGHFGVDAAIREPDTAHHSAAYTSTQFIFVHLVPISVTSSKPAVHMT